MVTEIALWPLGVFAHHLEIELEQLHDEGRDASSLRNRFLRLIALGDEKLKLAKNQAKGEALLDAAQRLKMKKDYPFDEPSDFAGIRKLRGRGPRRYKKTLSDPELLNRMTGAWEGRCIGCLLGKPVEAVQRAELWEFLKSSRQWPLERYIRLGGRSKAVEKFSRGARNHPFDTLDHMPIDDDTNYTMAGYLIVKHSGADFTPADVGMFWLSNIPIVSLGTAECVTYRNLTNLVQPPASATWRNPYREWIGAQIRADAYGYVNLGNPVRAAEFAFRDASISHIKNGIYGSMFVAAMTAAAPFCTDLEDLIRVGLSEIPRTSRLYAAIMEVLEWRAKGVSYYEAVEMIHEKWDETSFHDVCHTIPNAVICAVALLWGDGDFGRTICRAVEPCFDTDCNGATVGSIMGMFLGSKGISEEWKARVNNTLKTSLAGYDTVDIKEVARETFDLYRSLR